MTAHISQFIPHYSKFTEIKSPTPTGLIVFMEVHEDEIIDTEFGIPVEADSWSQGYWWDIPANRHNQGCNLSFADGHVEHWKWKVPKLVTVPRGYEQSVAADEWDDYNRCSPAFARTSTRPNNPLGFPTVPPFNFPGCCRPTSDH